MLNRFKPVVPALAICTVIATLPAHAETAFTVNGVDVDSSIVDAYMQSRLQKPVAQATAEEKAALQDELTSIYLLTTQPRTEELAKEPWLQAQLELQRRGILAQAAMQDYMQRNPATEAEIAAEYDRQAKMAPEQQYKARHILVETQGEASELIAKLNDGADFAELATEHSTGPSAPSGGDLGWFSPNQMVPPFSEAVMALEDGKYTEEPVQTQFGWHVILREDSREAEAPTLESVHDAIKQHLEQQKLQDYLTQLRELDN